VWDAKRHARWFIFAALTDSNTFQKVIVMSDPVAAEKSSFLLPEFPVDAISPAVPQPDAPRRRVSDIPVEIQAVIGKTKVSVAQLMAAGEGARFRLDKHFGDPVELQVNGQVIGYGEIIADDRDNLVGVRLTSIEVPR
jgi:flagellar motor switch protein FliN/FliY